MEGFLQLATGVNITVLMVDSSDHITGATGLSAGLTIYATKAAGTPAAITPTVTELDATNVKGVYKLALTSGHTGTLGELQLHITATGADPTDLKWQVSTNLPGESANQTGDSFARIGAAGAGLTALGDTRVANLDAAVTTRMASYTQPTGFLAATFPSGTVANTTNITAGTITTATNLTTNNDKTGYALSSAGVQAIWDALTSALTTAGSVGKKLADWSIGSLTSGERNSVADAILDRDMSTGADSGSPTVRTVRQALRVLRNKISVAAGTMTVAKEDDSTTSWTAAVTTTVGADPVTGIDPAGP
jgi:hypothetical protein